MADDLPAVLAKYHERNEGRIRAMRYTDYTVEHDVAEGDVRRLLKAVEAVLELAGELAESGEMLATVPAHIVLPERGLASRMATARERNRVAGLLRTAVLGELAGNPKPEPFKRPESCICTMFRDTGGFRIADLTCPVHGVGGTDPGDGNWEKTGEGNDSG